MTRLLAWLRALWRRREIQATLDEELDFHVAMEAGRRRAEGLSASEARQQALADFGEPSLVRADILEVRTPSLVRITDGIWQDVHYAVRTFARTPLTIGSVIVVLAVAIGVTSTAFAAIDAVFFKRLDVPRADRLAYVSGPASAVDLDVFAQRAQGAVERFAGTQAVRGVLSNHDLQVRAKGEEVTADYFTALDIRPVLGRFFNAGETNTGDGPVDIVISYDLWKSRLDLDPSIVGSAVQFDGRVGTIVGVAPPRFRGVSLPWEPSQFWMIQRRPVSFRRTVSAGIIVRLAPGVSPESLAAAVARHDEAEPDAALTAFTVRPAVGPLVPEAQLSSFGFVRALADTVAAMALVVMLIAASNVVGILLARGVARSTELAVRQALGAGARRLAQQLGTESLLLGLAAGVAGLLVAWLLIGVYRAVAPPSIAIDIDINARVLGVTLLVCVVAGLLVGIAPVRQALRVDLLAALGAPGATVSTSTRQRLRYGAVLPPVALSVALLIVATAHARALSKVEFQDPGFELDNLISMRVSPPMRFFAPQQNTLADATNREYFHVVLDRLAHAPGVAGVAFATATPAEALQFPKHPHVTRVPNEVGTTAASAIDLAISSNFLTTVGIPLVEGRAFDDERDQLGSPTVLIVSQSFARAVAPDGRALGRFVQMPKSGGHGQQEWQEIVGVAGDVRNGADVVPMVYSSINQLTYAFFPRMILARVSAAPATVAHLLARDVAAIDERAQVEEPLTQTEILARTHFVRRLALALVGLAGMFGVALAAIGLYSAVSYSVAQQRRSLAIRATLGASGGQLVRQVVSEGGRTVLIAFLPGICLGLVAFRVTAGLIAFVAGPVSAPDLAVVAGVCAAVGALSMAACLLPGWRASHVSMHVLLR